MEFLYRPERVPYICPTFNISMAPIVSKAVPGLAREELLMAKWVFVVEDIGEVNLNTNPFILFNANALNWVSTLVKQNHFDSFNPGPPEPFVVRLGIGEKVDVDLMILP